MFNYYFPPLWLLAFGHLPKIVRFGQFGFGFALCEAFLLCPTDFATAFGAL